MAIVMETNYSKKLGLPGYSSHQYSVTVRTELADLSAVEAESKRLYGLLQTSVDREIRQSGYLPPGHEGPNGNGSAAGEPGWNCSDKQRDLILKIVAEHRLDKLAVEQLAQDRFSKGVRQLNKLEASGLIDELLAQHGGNGQRGSRARQPGGAR